MAKAAFLIVHRISPEQPSHSGTWRWDVSGGDLRWYDVPTTVGPAHACEAQQVA